MRQPIRGPLRLVMPGTAPLPAEFAHNDHSPVPRDAGRRPGIADRAANLEARTPYLFLRHGTYYFKRKIPSDVRHGFPEFRSGQLFRSLGTGLLQQAKVLLAVEVTEFDLRVAQLRREAAQQQALVRAAEAREVYGRAKAAAATKPAVPAQPLTSPSLSFSYQLPWGSGSAWPAVSMPAPLIAAQKRPAVAAATSRPATRKTSQPALSAPAPAAVDVTSSPAARQAQQAASRRETEPEAQKAAAKAGTGAVRIKLDTVAATTTMLHLYESWKLTQDRPRTLATVHTTVMEFRTLHGPLPVAAITKSHARAYRDVLIERGLSKRTIENKLGHLSTLVRFGMRELIEDHPLNAFERIDIIGATGLYPAKDRRAYTVRELNTIFSSPLYTADYRPGGQVTDAAYWLPILGPFVGARIEELCQLRIEDVQRINGSWCIRICDLGEGQEVKTLSSFRRVPLHDVVVRSGFIAYVARMAAAGHERVFPTLTNDNSLGIYSNAAGKWYARFLDSIGLTDRRLDYHSYRYTLRQQMSLCGVQNETRDALTGHWISNTDSGRTYMKAEQRQYPYPLLVEAVGKLQYDGLKVEHLFVDDPLQGTERLLGS